MQTQSGARRTKNTLLGAQFLTPTGGKKCPWGLHCGVSKKKDTDFFSGSVATLRTKRQHWSQSQSNKSQQSQFQEVWYYPAGDKTIPCWCSGTAAIYSPLIVKQPQVRLATTEDPGCHVAWCTKTKMPSKHQIPQKCRTLTEPSPCLLFTVPCICSAATSFMKSKKQSQKTLTAAFK